jgi:hypothetical protein
MRRDVLPVWEGLRFYSGNNHAGGNPNPGGVGGFDESNPYDLSLSPFIKGGLGGLIQ